MRLEGLLKPLTEGRDYKSILSNIEKNRFPVEISGVSESARSYIIDALYEDVDKPILILTHSDVEARNLYEDLSFFVPNVYYFPTRELVFYNVYAVSGDLRWERLKVIHEIASGGKKIIITCIETLASSYIPIKLYRLYTFRYKTGDELNLKEFGEKLIECGYERCDIVEAKGQFSIRGGIMDIFPPASGVPCRIELFGDEIDSIRTFNVESQRSIDKVQDIEIFPAKEMILDSKTAVLGQRSIEKDLEAMLNNFKGKKDKEAYDKIHGIINQNLEALRESRSFETIDSFLPYFFENGESFLDYLKDYMIIVDDVQRCKGKLQSTYFEFEESYKSFLQRGDILPKQGKLMVPKEDILSTLEGRDVITLNAISKSTDMLMPASFINFSEINLHNYHGQLELLIEDIKDKKSKGYKIVILSGTRPRGERLVNTLMDNDIMSSYKDVIHDIKAGEVVITFGSVLRGFEYPDIKVCVISDKEVFGEAKRRLPSRVQSRKGIGKIKSFAELKPGDYVVHVNHGIGVYKGIKQLEIQGHIKDYLELVYDSDDKLYVPVEQLDMVQKYIGSEGKQPRINKLGSDQWIKAKNKVKKSIQEIAEDLVKLYAIRSTVKGYVYSRDTVWQRQFEDEFPYDETPDQLTAIEDIKKDMECDKPMDRLLCGDVGYGKTEVAIRAAFKAVMDGKQVAFLVPTTILAQQHYNNMVRRFSDFPVKVDMISRFRTPAQQKKTIQAVKEGSVDILIGTHRILQKDVQFKDLGVLIIDEEQRFGVTHKEKIKELKKNVDVLTLSATPIPRTLHMSLTGVRDISVIETPPEERYPIQTYVVEYNDQLIRDAILRELNRGGQVYFVHNRVEDIQEMASYVSKLVPEARVSVAHGQMGERELENVIVEFMKGESDILVSTTIIETGMDIQNVNTMIIYDADKFGLSQLYQLRGRVGRTNRIAYCYLTYRKDKVLTEVAEKRLRAIKDFTELGSGFKIALKDLEIRGAGNMMGAAQHGHMAAVGYDLYCRMLEDMVKIIKGEIKNEPVETTVEIKLDAYIPEAYISDESQKIEVYKKIAAIGSKEDMQEIEDELIDRFSDIPPSVQNLIQIAYIRSIAKKLGIEDLKEAKEQVYIQFESSERIEPDVIKKALIKFRKNLSPKIGAEKPVLIYWIKDTKKADLLIKLREILEFIEEITIIK